MTRKLEMKLSVVRHEIGDPRRLTELRQAIDAWLLAADSRVALTTSEHPDCRMTLVQGPCDLPGQDNAGDMASVEMRIWCDHHYLGGQSPDPAYLYALTDWNRKRIFTFSLKLYEAHRRFNQFIDEVVVGNGAFGVTLAEVRIAVLREELQSLLEDRDELVDRLHGALAGQAEAELARERAEAQVALLHAQVNALEVASANPNRGQRLRIAKGAATIVVALLGVASPILAAKVAADGARDSATISVEAADSQEGPSEDALAAVVDLATEVIELCEIVEPSPP